MWPSCGIAHDGGNHSTVAEKSMAPSESLTKKRHVSGQQIHFVGDTVLKQTGGAHIDLLFIHTYPSAAVAREPMYDARRTLCVASGLLHRSMS